MEKIGLIVHEITRRENTAQLFSVSSCDFVDSISLILIHRQHLAL
jgi:hypothetical protein